jgi:hypothetical protein
MIWNLDQARADFRSHEWQGSLELTTPESGISILAPNKKEVAGILSVSFPKPSLPLRQDCYIRQSDLIVVYPPREMRKFHLQLDYRILNATSETLLIEIWISVQTYLLDNHPVVSLISPFFSNELTTNQTDADGTIGLCESGRKFEPAKIATVVPKIAVVAGPVSPDLFMAMLNHPRDQFDTTWSRSESHPHLEAKLFGHFMEKGVIRRARMRCLMSAQPFSQGLLQEAYDAFVKSPLPLTA